jgi:predicted lactoylglutathione lyase
MPGGDAGSTESLLALALESRAKVDKMVDKAVATGGSEYREKQDCGWMYGRSFQDIDGHIWEPFYADLDAAPEEMKNRK